MLTCIKCDHKWFERSIVPPKRCPSHTCRTLHWNGFSPAKLGESVMDRSILTESKHDVISEMRAKITHIEETPQVKRPAYAPQMAPRNHWEEPTIS